MPNGIIFVDTNVWVARIIEDHVFHQRAHVKLNQLVEQEELFCLSGQIIRELISVCSLGRNLSRPLCWDELRQQVDALLAQTILLNENETSTRKLVELGEHYQVIGKQIHDTNIVATMLTHGITRLVTFNPDDFRRFTEIEVIVP
ncbi:MAG: PIN domain-containing protein [candidate division KSB1 bacterium]|nr:PIN domain-containing protein [candidate division KSB1 bacterium]MDZ7304426.1 PIN domain-containing protein [candidate division KSB1 bacterium]MDZ7313376.1 PIN domain-containing protein [candidate division KSB1 bacterium]